MADLDPELDRLHALPLAEFITARNALAKRLRAAGERQQAEEVKALAKPSVTAWAVNALYHHERNRFEALLAAATAVRAALAGQGDRRRAEAARRKALQALLGRAAALLVEAGHAVTPANRQRISHTLEALAARDPEAAGPRPGRLVADLEPQGFDVLAGLAARLPRAVPSAPRPAKRPAGKAATPSRATAARDRRLVAARRRLERREAELTRLEQEVEEAETAASKATERHERLAEEAAEARQRARTAVEAAANAKSELTAARASLAAARAARRRALSRLATARRQLERHES